MTTGSTGREDLFGPRTFEPVDGASADEGSILAKGVHGGAGAVAARPLNRDPLDPQLVADQDPGPLVDGPGDQPGDDELGDGVSFGDHDRAGILGTERVHPVDDVGADDAGPVIHLGAGQAAGGHGEREGNGGDESHGPGESIDIRMSAWMRRAAIIGGLLVAAVMAFAVFEPIQVLPRIRLAPGFVMTDQAGEAWTSDAARGAVTLYAFAYGGCGRECDALHSTMAEVVDRAATEVDLGGVDLRAVTISFDPARDAPRLDLVAEAAGADGVRWRWAVLDESDVANVVGAGFRVFTEQLDDGSFAFDPTYVLVDGWGVIRGEYRYATLADDADKLVRHIGLLGEELRNSTGVASIAYEAAHVFLCYP
jgi:protein SCO1/2